MVEAGRGGAGRVLEDRLQLVEALGEPRLGAAGGRVVLPELQQLGAQVGGQGGAEGLHVGPLPRLAAVVGGLERRRHVARDRLAQVVDQRQLQQPLQVQARKIAGEEHDHQREAPGMLGRALRPPARGEAGAERVLQALGPLQEGEDAGEAVGGDGVGHGARVRARGRAGKGAHEIFGPGARAPRLPHPGGGSRPPTPASARPGETGRGTGGAAGGGGTKTPPPGGRGRGVRPAARVRRGRRRPRSG